MRSIWVFMAEDRFVFSPHVTRGSMINDLSQFDYITRLLECATDDKDHESFTDLADCTERQVHTK